MYPPPSRILQTPIAGKQKQSGIWSRGGDTEVRIVVLHRSSAQFHVYESQKISTCHCGEAPCLVHRFY